MHRGKGGRFSSRDLGRKTLRHLAGREETGVCPSLLGVHHRGWPLSPSMGHPGGVILPGNRALPPAPSSCSLTGSRKSLQMPPGPREREESSGASKGENTPRGEENPQPGDGEGRAAPLEPLPPGRKVEPCAWGKSHRGAEKGGHRAPRPLRAGDVENGGLPAALPPPSILPSRAGRGGGAVPEPPGSAPLSAGVPALHPRPHSQDPGVGSSGGDASQSPPLPGVEGRYRCSPANPPGASSGASSGHPPAAPAARAGRGAPYLAVLLACFGWVLVSIDIYI